jgi:hypothetical protein
MTSSRRALALKTETIRELSSRETAGAAGGATSGTTVNINVTQPGGIVCDFVNGEIYVITVFANRETAVVTGIVSNQICIPE